MHGVLRIERSIGGTSVEPELAATLRTECASPEADAPLPVRYFMNLCEIRSPLSVRMDRI
jgi:hypothetical protein